MMVFIFIRILVFVKDRKPNLNIITLLFSDIKGIYCLM